MRLKTPWMFLKFAVNPENIHIVCSSNTNILWSTLLVFNPALDKESKFNLYARSVLGLYAATINKSAN